MLRNKRTKKPVNIYRGAKRTERTKRKSISFWTPDRGAALSYAKLRNGKILRAQVIDKPKIVYGGLPNVAKAVGLHKELYLPHNTTKEGLVRFERKVARKARGKGYDIQVIDRDQVAVLNPQAITIIGSRNVKKRKS